MTTNLSFQKAEHSLRFYRNCQDKTDLQGDLLVTEELQKLVTIAKQKAEMPPIELNDFCISYV